MFADFKTFFAACAPLKVVTRMKCRIEGCIHLQKSRGVSPTEKSRKAARDVRDTHAGCARASLYLQNNACESQSQEPN